MSIDGWIFRGLMLVTGLMPVTTTAAISPRDYAEIGVATAADAAVPLDAMVIGEDGRARRLADLVSLPTVLVFADYTCTTLCGPIVAFVTDALDQSGLRPGAEFRLLVIGLDPKDGPDDATRMRHAYLADDPALDAASSFVTADRPTVQQLTRALGYRFAYDAENDQFVHPGAAYVLRSDGRVARVLTGLGVSGGDLRLALVGAGEGRIGTLGDQIRLICSGFDPAHGIYNLMASRLLVATGLGTVLMLGSLICLLMLPGRRGRPS
jgi:protein SCO1/2